MFNPQVTVEMLNMKFKKNMLEHLDIEFIEVGPDFIKARMPVDHRTKQPMGILHGGASVTLAETLGSAAASCLLDPEKQYCVGLDINSNHIKSITEGYVIGVTKPIHVGKKTQVWEIRIENEDGQLVNISRITMAVIDKK